MAISHLRYDVDANERELVQLTGAFVGAGSSQPTGVTGRGVSVEREGTGRYTILFDGITLPFEVVAISVTVNNSDSANVAIHTDVEWAPTIAAGFGLRVRDLEDSNAAYDLDGDLCTFVVTARAR